MSDQLLAVISQKAAGLVQNASQSSSSSSSTPAAPAVEVGTTTGEKGLKRLPVGNKQAESARQGSTTGVDSSSEPAGTVEAYTTMMELMFDLLSKVSVNLSTSQNNMAEILNYEALQGETATKLAEQNQIDTNNQLDEQARKQKKMKFIGWGIKALAVTIAVAGTVASGGMLAAPLTSTLLLTFTMLTTLEPNLLNNKVIGPLTKGFESVGVPPAWANVLATLTVVTAIVVASGASGLGDKKLIGKAGMQYAQYAAGVDLLSSSTILSQAAPSIAKFTEKMAPDAKWLPITAVVLTLVTSVLLGASGGLTMAAAGRSIAGETSSLRSTARMATTALNVAKGGTEVAQGSIMIQMGDIQKNLSELQANLSELNASLKTVDAFTQSTKALMQMITQSQQALAQGTHSLTVPAQGAA